MASKPVLLLQAVVDFSCPWCYIGSQRLKRFLLSPDYRDQVAPHVRAVLRIEPFILGPRLAASTFDTPEGVYDAFHTTPYQKNRPSTKELYYGSKVGGNLDAFDWRIAAAAQELDLPRFDWSSEGKVGATYDAHRLVWKVSQLDLQNSRLDGGAPEDCVKALQVRLAEALYCHFHCNNKDMSDRDYLAGVACELGLFGDRQEALAWLASDAGDDEVRRKLKVAEMNGVMNMPFYIINMSAPTAERLVRAEGGPRSPLVLKVRTTLLTPVAPWAGGWSGRGGPHERERQPRKPAQDDDDAGRRPLLLTVTERIHLPGRRRCARHRPLLSTQTSDPCRSPMDGPWHGNRPLST
ncbi:hypothetical protein ACQY0O_003253 [Thecaphora frezii]